jgi:carboxypeptidase Taq
VFENPLVKEILSLSRRIWALHHALSLMGWDAETYMPPAGLEERSIATGELTMLVQELVLNPKLVELVEKAESAEDLNDYERGVVRVLSRSIRIAKALPPRLVGELARLGQEARGAWLEARRRNDYSVFKPYMERIIELEREAAEHLGYEEHPYDALLDLHEEGLTTRDMDRVFNAIEPVIRSVLNHVLSEGYYPRNHPLEKARYREEDLKRLNEEVLVMLGYPLGERGRLDTSPHPFTTGIGIDDVRITTRYEGYDFKRSLLGTIHEFGHALYELQVDKRLKTTPLAGGVSAGIHESQSRFWENMVGRSRVFAEKLFPLLTKHLGDVVRGREAEDIYRYFNTVRPSPIRTEADEVTYNLHILLRYRLEKQMIQGDLGADELPEAWNRGMEELLGIRPRSSSDGVLQDIHWSMASIGYFPTYTLGNVVAAQVWSHMEGELKLYERIAEGDFASIRRYLEEKVHRWGSTYAPKELLRRSFGEEINPSHFARYLKTKYVEKRI